MDETGCPNGLATDRAFLHTPFANCSASVAEFWGIAMSVCTIRLLALFAKFHAYVTTPDIPWQSRRTLTVTVSIIESCSYVVCSVLIGLNIANAENGWSFALFSIIYACFVIDFTMMLVKIVRLGRRVIALPREHMVENDYLSKFTILGGMMLAFQIIMAVVSCICLIVLSPIFPGNEQFLGTLGFATKGLFQFLCSLGIVVALDKFMEAPAGTGRKTAEDFQSSLKKLRKARKILRLRQLFVIIFGGGVSVILLGLAAGIPWTWQWVLLGPAIPESIGHFLVEFGFNRKTGQGGKSSSHKPEYMRNGSVQDSKSSNDVLSQGLPSIRESSTSFKKHRLVIFNKNSSNKLRWKQKLSRIAEENSKMVSVSELKSSTNV